MRIEHARYSARVVTAPHAVSSLPRWLIYAGLWLLLSCVFASQIYFAGYIKPWPRAFAAEAI